MKSIRIAVVGVGNCASSLIQGIEYYRQKGPQHAVGLMNWNLGGYKPYEIHVAAAFDIDRRKIIIPQTIKELGVYQVEIKLHSDVKATLRVWVTAI